MSKVPQVTRSNGLLYVKSYYTKDNSIFFLKATCYFNPSVQQYAEDRQFLRLAKMALLELLRDTRYWRG